ncbi:MAG: hypothetical protein E6Q97_20795, partial [Desulfurellales bacterium]
MAFNFSTHLKIASRNGPQISAHVPWRKDRNPSFSCNEDTGVWLDFATGETGNWRDFCERMNLRSELESTSGPLRGAAPSAAEIISTKQYVYRSPDGRPALRVTRKNLADGGKTFTQEHADGSQWVSGGFKGELLPYMFDRWNDDPKVFLCEGEKAAEAAATLGLNATCTPGGANK